MPQNSIKPGRSGSSPFVKPILHALNRMQERTRIRPEQLTERARRLLDTQFGIKPVPVESTFARGCAGLLVDHTAYFNGFAFMLPLSMGTAVAVRTTDTSTSRVVLEGDGTIYTFDRSSVSARTRDPMWLRTVQHVTHNLVDDGVQVEVAVVSTIPASLTQSFLGALGMATARAFQALFAVPDGSEPVPVSVARWISDALGSLFSPAYTIVSEAATSKSFSLVDVGTLEHLTLDAPPREILGWGLIDVAPDRLPTRAQALNRKEKLDQAIAALRTSGFSDLASLRDLDHRDLQRALSLIQRELRPVVRHLVMENRRVQKIIFAARRNDWQMMGAMLLMSFASRRHDWFGDHKRADFVMEQVEAMTLEGMYGATLLGSGGMVITMGQPYIVPQCLDRVSRAYQSAFEIYPQTYLV